MKAFVCHQLGAPETLSFEDIVLPEISAGTLRVEVHASDIGYQDLLLVSGSYLLKPSLPFVPGNVVAGTVVEIGPGESRHKIGDRVVALLPFGGHAEGAIVRSAAAVPIPAGVTFAEAAALGIAYATAYQGLVDCAHLKAGETLLVRGATGGVGLAAVDIGRALGATVIAAVSSEPRATLAVDAGAHHAIINPAEGLREPVRELTSGRGADVVFDTVGADFRRACLQTVARRGRILIVGFAGGEIPQIPANYPLNKYCSIHGVAWGYSVLEHEPEDYARILSAVLALKQERRIGMPGVVSVPPDGAIERMTQMAARAATGRAVIQFQTVSDEPSRQTLG